MANKTTYFDLLKPTEEEQGDVAIINGNMDILDEELHKRGTTVNGEEPDDNGNYQINEVLAARQIATDDNQQSSGEFIMRTTGGNASLSDGPAKLSVIFGRSLHTGATAESLTMTVNAVPREEGEEPITAEIDRDTFVEYVSTSGTTTLTYTDAWSSNPTLYGVTVTGTPVSGDEIVIVYVKEERGTITNSNPTAFISTGWNLYNNTNGYARVLKYSDQYGFRIGGTYTAVQFSETLTGAKTTITPVSGYFTIPSDGYVWVTGGNATDTYVLMTWSDWTSGPEGEWKIYSQSTVDLSTAMTNFANGLMSVGGVADEINLDMGKAFSRIERMAYSAANLATAKASGRPWDADEDYIYLVRATPVEYAISISGDFTANDHGMEMISSTTVPVFVQTIYGENLVDKLRTDIPNQLASHSQSIAKLDESIAIVSDGNTHGAIASGQYVYVKNHGTLTEGLYTANSAISANATLSGSNVTLVSGGGLNALNSNITSLSDHMGNLSNLETPVKTDVVSAINSKGNLICKPVNPAQNYIFFNTTGFSAYRSCLFVCYITQNGDIFAAVVMYFGDTVGSRSIKVLTGQTGITAEMKENSVFQINGIGDWGTGFVIGRNA